MSAVPVSIPTTTNPGPVAKSPSPRRYTPPDQSDETDEYYDKDAMRDRARELAASITAEEFGIVLRPGDIRAVSLDDLIKNPKAYDNIGHRGTVVTELPPAE